jgi:hypothetical protein
VYDTQNYWAYGLCLASGVEELEHDVSETDPVSQTECSGFFNPGRLTNPEPR